MVMVDGSGKGKAGKGVGREGDNIIEVLSNSNGE